MSNRLGIDGRAVRIVPRFKGGGGSGGGSSGGGGGGGGGGGW